MRIRPVHRGGAIPFYRKRDGRERGFSIVLVTLALGLAATLGFVLSSIVVSDLHSSVTGLEAAQALAAAEAGVELAVGWLSRLPSPPEGLTPIAFASGLPVASALADVEIVPASGNAQTYLKRYTVRATARAGDATRVVQVQVRIASFSDYLWATNDEGYGVIWYYTGDVIDGPLFSNDRLAIWGSPVFLGPVYSAANDFLRGDSFNPDFRQGYQLGVPRITLPTMTDIAALYQRYGSGNPFTLYGRNNNPVQLTFKVQGGVGYMYYVGYDEYGHPMNGSIPIDEIPDGLVRVRGNVRVRGTLKGRLTLLTERKDFNQVGNIYITRDIVYSCADAEGRPLPGCQDVLGLVSEANVIVGRNAHQGQDCIIDAAILALGNSFTVEDYNRGQFRGRLIVWGSIAQNVRGPVGTFGRRGQTGYSKDYHYDQRLAESPPPFFPPSGRLVVESWREVSPD